MYYGKQTCLRSLELSDLDDLMRNWNKMELRDTLNSVFPNTREEEEEWIRRTWKSRREGSDFVFAIEDLNGTWLGTIGLHKIDRVNQSCELGIAIHHPNHRGKGNGSDAIITLCGLAFLQLNLSRVSLEYLDHNEQGARAYEKAGFTSVGRKRQAIYRNGSFEDLMQMDILRDEWFEKFGEEYNLLPPK